MYSLQMNMKWLSWWVALSDSEAPRRPEVTPGSLLPLPPTVGLVRMLGRVMQSSLCNRIGVVSVHY